MSIGRCAALAVLLLGAQPLAAQVRTVYGPPHARTIIGPALDAPARLSIDGAALRPALEGLAQRSGLSLVYSGSLLPGGAHTLRCLCEDLTVREALDVMLSGTQLQYLAVDRQIVIFPRPRTGLDFDPRAPPKPGLASSLVLTELPALAPLQQVPTAPNHDGLSRFRQGEREWDRINGTPGYAAVFKNKAAGLLRLVELGGGHLITTGTDNWNGSRMHDELFALAYVGLPLDLVLKAATINGASALGMGDELGTIEVGKLADLYVVRGNPLEDISATRNGRLVMQAGQLYEVEELLRAVEGRIRPMADASD